MPDRSEGELGAPASPIPPVETFTLRIEADTRAFSRAMWRCGYLIAKDRRQDPDPNPMPARFHLFGRRSTR